MNSDAAAGPVRKILIIDRRCYLPDLPMQFLNSAAAMSEGESARLEAVRESLLESARGCQPSSWQVCEAVEQRLGTQALWLIQDAMSAILNDPQIPGAQKAYFGSLLRGEDLDQAIRGFEPPRRQVESTIDQLLDRGRAYRTSGAFRGMVEFMARFRNYSPYNNMLVRLQNPACGFYATASDWQRRFDRDIKEDARPMLILAPMHPVMLVYGLDDTEGEDLPDHLQDFARFTGPWDPRRLEWLLKNAEQRDRIQVQFKELSSVQAGFATTRVRGAHWKMRVAIHDGLDDPSRFGVLCHELAYIHLGHRGADADGFWPSRGGLGTAAMEVEAESVAYVVGTRMDLEGASPAYVSNHMPDGQLPIGVSLDLIAKVSGLIEKMASGSLPPRRG